MCGNEKTTGAEVSLYGSSGKIPTVLLLFFRAKTKFSIFSLLATASSLLALDPVHPNIIMHIQHSILYTFPEVLTWRICSTIKNVFSW